ncbi:hypothetical protein DHW03_03355 [Pedobacter yonginense]|uniref:histidine kinase n=1 Tax=Pedobacter yonginense TaxID=651869 RepID=A0A317ESN3_9SPHI|nr:HAMP domain-containing sensor histidine kinase [Pedobacter yonginense]PWS28883.1 hypothetical protein DHW03_03355 [Pedobacter yonginense]
MPYINTSINIDPIKEEARLQKLLDYEILDTPAENGFNHIAQLAKGIFNAENAYVAFVDADRIFLKADTANQESSSIKKEDYLFPIASLESRPVVLEDTRALSGFDQNEQFVLPDIGFCVTSPIVTADGYVIGSVGVTDSKTKQVTEDQINMLNLLSKMVLDKLETRLAIRKSFRAQDDRLHMLVHDLKNPMTTISLQSELAGRIPGAGEKVALIAGKINQQSKLMIENLNFILSAARKEKETFKMQKVKVDLKLVLERVLAQLSRLNQTKNQNIKFSVEEIAEVYGDESKLDQIFYHLIENAIKFSETNQEIQVSITSADNLVVIAIKDYGRGLTEADLERLFVKFAKLSSNPTTFEDSNGLGLLTVKMLVDMHKGKVWAESEGQNLGSTFFVELPIK